MTKSFHPTLFAILLLFVLVHAQSDTEAKKDDDDDPGETAQDLASDLAP